jgi:glucose/arabinose dehydrogenase
VRRISISFAGAAVATFGAAASGFVLASALPASGATARPKVVTIRVQARDFDFALSRTRVQPGVVRFAFVNRGSAQHDFAIAGRKTRVLPRGGRAVVEVRLRKPGRYSFLCTVAGHAALGMKGTLVVARPGKAGPFTPPTTTTTTTATPPVYGEEAVLRATPIGTFERPVFVTSPPGDERRVFVVEQRGVIRVVDNGSLLGGPFLDIEHEVKIENETGLFALAFAPDYATSRRLYISYSDREGNGDFNVVEYRHKVHDPYAADSVTKRTVLHVVKPWENHNAGMLQFGPDGYLYVAIGDGDSGVVDKPGAFAQTLDDLLGNILRIDPREARDAAYSSPESNPFVDVAGARPEVWAYGLRNPWRFWIDTNGDMLIGDVGEGVAEEIDLVPAGHGGLNFGWPCFEGSVPFDTTMRCPNAVFPLFDYSHANGACSVTGGVVLRDPRLPALEGLYLYADLCVGALKGLRLHKGAAPESVDLGVTVSQPTSFGVDGLGRVYVTSLEGPVYRLDPETS